MAKEFLTEKDIEDMVKRGTSSLEINDNVILTELAYEKANRLGLKLVQSAADLPPSAPVRPYMSQKPGQQTSAGSSNGAPRPVAAVPVFNPPPRVDVPRANGADGADLHQRIRAAVIARLGTQIDANLLDAIIRRVLNATGVR